MQNSAAPSSTVLASKSLRHTNRREIYQYRDIITSSLLAHSPSLGLCVDFRTSLSASLLKAASRAMAFSSDFLLSKFAALKSEPFSSRKVQVALPSTLWPAHTIHMILHHFQGPTTQCTTLGCIEWESSQALPASLETVTVT